MGTEPGVKLDDEKLDLYGLLLEYFPDALREVCKVSTFGAKKYVKGGWRSVPSGYNRYTSALVRHLVEGTTERTDSDSGLSHDAHRAWNSLATLQLRLERERDEEAGDKRPDKSKDTPTERGSTANLLTPSLDSTRRCLDRNLRPPKRSDQVSGRVVRLGKYLDWAGGREATNWEDEYEA
jgi:hypothetical protein